MKKILLGVVIGALITAFLFIKFWPRPGPEKPVKITEATNPATGTVQERRQGYLTGTVTWPASIVPNSPGDIAENNNTQENKTTTPGPALGEYHIPVTGTLKTDYYYSGQLVGNGVHEISGETTVILAPEGITADTKFEDETNLRIDLPDPPRRLWHIGGYLATDFNRVGFGCFFQRDFPIGRIGKIDVQTFGRMEIDWDRRLITGLELSF